MEWADVVRGSAAGRFRRSPRKIRRVSRAAPHERRSRSRIACTRSQRLYAIAQLVRAAVSQTGSAKGTGCSRRGHEQCSPSPHGRHNVAGIAIDRRRAAGGRCAWTEPHAGKHRRPNLFRAVRERDEIPDRRRCGAPLPGRARRREDSAPCMAVRGLMRIGTAVFASPADGCSARDAQKQIDAGGLGVDRHAGRGSRRGASLATATAMPCSGSTAPRSRAHQLHVTRSRVDSAS